MADGGEVQPPALRDAEAVAEEIDYPTEQQLDVLWDDVKAIPTDAGELPLGGSGQRRPDGPERPRHEDRPKPMPLGGSGHRGHSSPLLADPPPGRWSSPGKCFRATAARFFRHLLN